MWSFIVDTWNTLVFEPLFNAVTIILAIMPWHNFGLALIIFTILTRVVFYPVIKRQLLQLHKQRQIQPEVAKIKKKYKGNRQQETMATMALYKEKGFNPFAMLFYLLLQFPLLLALYQIIKNIATDTQNFFEHSYGFVKDLPWMKDLAADPTIFDSTLLGSVDLIRPAFATVDGQTVFYLGAFIILLATAIVQYFTSKQMMTHSSSKPRKLRELLKAQAAGQDVDQSEISAATSRFLVYIIPFLIFVLGLGWFAALPFYWLINGLMQYWQHQRFNQRLETASAKVKVDGQALDGEVRLNAKQKKEAAKRFTATGSSGRKRVEAVVKTKSKSKPASKKRSTNKPPKRGGA